VCKKVIETLDKANLPGTTEGIMVKFADANHRRKTSEGSVCVCVCVCVCVNNHCDICFISCVDRWREYDEVRMDANQIKSWL